MKKYLHLFLLLFVISCFAKAQSGPSSTANWFGYILPSSPAENKYVTFTMQNLGSVAVASDEIPAANTATFANGYVWSVNNDNGYNICRSSFDAANNFIGAPEVMVAGLSYINDMAYNPADGMIYVITGEHLKSFDPANPGSMQDHGVIEHDGFNMAINMDGDAYLISSWGEFGSLNLSNAQLTVINPIDLPIKMAFDMLTGELFGAHYGNLYQLNTNTGAYTLLGALNDGSNGYDPTCLFMTYGNNPTEFTVGDLNYRVNDDNVSVTVTGHVNGYEATGDLIIPESVNYEGNDYTVTVIGESAFLYCFYLTNLSIPNTVTTIEGGAFAYCQGFTGDLVIPNSVTTVGYGAFQICPGFDGDLIIGSSVTEIGDYAFNSCDGMTGILYIPSGVQSLGGNSFGYCAFSGIVVDPENSVYDSRNDCNAIIETSTNELLTGCRSTIISNTVTSIGYCAFRGVQGMTSIEIPNSVTNIGENAFAFCYDLTGDLTIPNSVKTIGPSAFFQCENFDGTLTIGESVSYIGDMAFRNCSNFTGAVSLATTPPVLDDEFGGLVFENFGYPILVVPCGCVDAYRNSSWYEPYGLNGFSEFIEDCSAVSETSGIVTAAYPNPTNGLIKIEAENIQNVSIFNTLGQVIFETSASGDVFEYDLSGHKAGLYYIKVETAKGIETKPVTVL
ncbi:MAG: leucine-rich repeat domain-containing protein [Bacteroidales bacterium]|nr:leucine-rich repeat domain-containing protein [Bacteroidales bacterium]